MLDHPSIAIGLGMLISLMLTESVGVTAGGLIVPGYIALNLHNPYMVLFTFSISLITLLIVNGLSKFIIIYGKRRLVFCLIISFLLGSIIREVPIYLMEKYDADFQFLLDFGQINVIQYWILSLCYQLVDLSGGDMIYIGYLIPGLIANWMEKQGIIVTASTIVIIASLINLILMVLGKYV